MIFLTYFKEGSARYSKKVCPNYWRVSFLKISVAWMRNDKASKMLRNELCAKFIDNNKEKDLYIAKVAKHVVKSCTNTTGHKAGMFDIIALAVEEDEEY